MSLHFATLRKLQAEDDATDNALDTFFVLVSGFLVFFMQCGFCMVSVVPP